MKPTSDPFPLDKIKEAVIYKALAAGFLTPLNSFFRLMTLEWGRSKTAHATLRGGMPVIVLGRKFFSTEVQSLGEAAEVVLHEIMHHAFRHLVFAPRLLESGYSRKIQNIAMDAIINAFLAKVGCAGFMERFYPDKDEFAFLRPNSRLFARTGSKRYDWDYEAEAFYWDLQYLRATLEEALIFFQVNFDETSDQLPLLGSHGEAQEGGEESDEAEADELPGEGEGGSVGEGGPSGSILSGDEAEAILRKVGVLQASSKSRNNFADIIRKVATFARKPGLGRTGMRQSRRMPMKLSRRDLVNVERDRELFTRPDYLLRDVHVFLDVSGSVTAYLPFVVGLMRTLKQSEFNVRAVCWADVAQDVSFGELLKGTVPGNLGVGTTGECVAAYIAENQVKHAVIITDNAAGRIRTRIQAQIHLCLMEGSSLSGSFLDSALVPRVKTYQLALK